MVGSKCERSTYIHAKIYPKQLYDCKDGISYKFGDDCGDASCDVDCELKLHTNMLAPYW